MEKMDRATEARILSSIERAIRLTKEGMESNKALLKIASEDRLHPEMVKRMAEAMNISRTRAHMQLTSAEKRADSFPLVDANWIIDQMYPRTVEVPMQQKAANWIPDEYNKASTENFFEVKPAPVTFTKAAEAREAPKSPFRESRLLDKQAGLKKSQRVAESDFRVAMFELTKQAEAVAMQFRDAYRFNFPEVERRVFAKYGSSGRKMMDMLYGLGSLGRIKTPIKRASLTEPEQLVWDGRKEPYSWIDRLCKQAETVEALGRKSIDREYDVAAFNNEHGFKQAWEAQKEPGLLDDILGDLPPFSFDKRGQYGAKPNPNAALAAAGIRREEAAGRGARSVMGREATDAVKAEAENPELATLARRNDAAQSGSVTGLVDPPPPPPPPPPSSAQQATLPAQKSTVLPAVTPAVLPVGAATKPKMPGMPKLAGVTSRPFAKRAFDPLAVGMAMGPLALGMREPPELSKYREVLADVYDPTHEAKMDSIKSKAMLNDFLSNDPILSSYEPEAVTNVYNQVASLSPSAARQPALMRGLLRKAIQQGGVIEPFEVHQLTQVEETLKGKKAPILSHLYTAEK
jgi:hypothetical protein